MRTRTKLLLVPFVGAVGTAWTYESGFGLRQVLLLFLVWCAPAALVLLLAALNSLYRRSRSIRVAVSVMLGLLVGSGAASWYWFRLRGDSPDTAAALLFLFGGGAAILLFLASLDSRPGDWPRRPLFSDTDFDPFPDDCDMANWPRPGAMGMTDETRRSLGLD